MVRQGQAQAAARGGPGTDVPAHAVPGETPVVDATARHSGVADPAVPIHLTRMREQPYSGFSRGLPYEPKLEQELFWEPSPVQARKPVGENGGVGLHLVWDAEVSTLVVEGVRPGGAAARSGLVEVDDIVCEVDGINVTGQPLDVVESLMRGQAGSVLRLVLMRCKEETGENVREVAITLVREPEQAQDVIRPKRTGVGITFETDAVDNAAKIKSLIRGSPAEGSGLIKPGDTLFEVDGTNVYRESLDVVAQLLLGEPGTQVRLLFLRGTRLFIEANIERQRISRQSDMDDVLRYAQSVRSASGMSKFLTSGDVEADAAERRSSIRLPASFHMTP